MKAWRFIFSGGSMAAAIQTFGARLIILAMNLATGILTANLLGAAGRGEQGAMALWPAVLTPILIIGLPASLVYNSRQSERFAPDFFYGAVGIALILGTTGGIIAALAMPLILTGYSADVVFGAQGLVLMLPVTLCNTLIYSVYESRGEFGFINVAMLGQTLVTLILLGGLGAMGELTSVRSAYCYVLPPLVFALIFGIRIVRRMPLSIRRAKMAARRMMSYGLRSYGIDVMGAIALYIDQLLLVALLTPSELGTYVVAVSLARMLHMISGATSTVLFAKVAAQPLDQVITFVSLSSRVTTTVTALIALALGLAAPILLPVVYGPDFAPAVYIFPILLAESVLSGTVRIIGQGLMGAGRPGTITMVQGFGLACVLPLMALLVPPYGLMGAAVSMLLSTLLRLAFIAASYEILLRRRMPGLLIRRSDISLLYRRIVS
jgi:O-antigen/teichoic acid export membrane protein